MAIAQVIPEHLLAVGRITSVYGVKGWVKIESFTEPRVNLFIYQPWYIASSNGFQTVVIDEHRPHGKGYAGHIRGVDDRDIAGTYCRKDIYIEKRLLPELASDELYWHQLEGLKVYSVGLHNVAQDGVAQASESQGQDASQSERVLLGKVSEVMETGANDVLVVKNSSDSIDTRERLIPWLEEVLYNIDLDKGEIDVYWDPDF